eukprot:COSAG01_NODE_3416_length_6122_cov_11.318114_9_plen_137_part_00
MLTLALSQGSNDMGWSQQLNGFNGAGGDGLPGVKTPHIDAMAHRCAAACCPAAATAPADGHAAPACLHSGVILNNYYVDTVCSPTRATVMTGRYPIHNTIDDFIHVQAAYGLPLNETTLPQLLKGKNYSCHAIGKW